MRITEGPDSPRRLILITLLGFVVVAVVSVATGLHAKQNSFENLIADLPKLFVAVIFGAAVITLQTKSSQRRLRSRYDDAMSHGDQSKADIYKAMIGNERDKTK